MKDQNAILIKTMLGIIAVSALLFLQGSMLICQINLQQTSMNQFIWGMGGIIAMLLIMAIGYKKILDYAYYIAAFGCLVTFVRFLMPDVGYENFSFLMFPLGDMTVAINIPVLLSITLGIGIVKFYSADVPALFGRHTQKIICGISFFCLFMMTFIRFIPKGYLLAIIAAAFVLAFVKKIFSRISLLIGAGIVIALVSVGLSLRRVPVFFAGENALAMIKAGGWNGTADTELLEYMPGAVTDFFYASNTYIYGLRSTTLILVLFAILLGLSCFAASGVKAVSGKNMIFYMSILMFIQGVFTFLTNFQIIRGLFYAGVPFLSYGANILGSFICLGFICSAVIGDFETAKKDGSQ